MKKFLSLIIAMLLIVSLFATTAVAFAEGEDVTKYTVTYSVGTDGEGTAPAAKSYSEGDKFNLAAANTFTPKKGFEFDGWEIDGEVGVRAAGDEYTMPARNITITAKWKVFDRKVYLKTSGALMEMLAKDEFFDNLKWPMGTIKIGETMMKNAADNLNAVFENIKYVDEDDNENGIKKADNDKIYVEYCRPSESPKGQETWQNSPLITSDITLSSSGWYLFRIVVKDSSGKNELYTSEKFSRYAEDVKNPVVALSQSMKDKVASGLTEGTKYTVSTSLSITDSSSTTVTYTIEKLVNGAWTTIYDSDKSTDKVTKGYEKYVDNDGAITPAKEDVSTEPVYKIIYSVVDTNGFVGVEQESSSVEFKVPMELFVNAAKVEKAKISAVEIVLFCIAGVAFIGIIVLIFIKPKQPAAVRNDVANTDDTTETDDTANNQ